MRVVSHGRTYKRLDCTRPWLKEGGGQGRDPGEGGGEWRDIKRRAISGHARDKGRRAVRTHFTTHALMSEREALGAGRRSQVAVATPMTCSFRYDGTGLASKRLRHVGE